MIYVPDEVDAGFVRYVDETTSMYAGVYGSLMHRSLVSYIERAIKKYSVINIHAVVTAQQAGLQLSVPAIDAALMATEQMGATLPSGLTLSERIWDLHNYSKDILAIIRNGIENKLSAETVAKQLDGFIAPGRHVMTTTPYGRALNFDSLRLARTELWKATRLADIESMKRTPWITGLRWELSSTHIESGCDCEGLDGTIFTREEDVPICPHPQCKCSLIPEILSNEEWDKAIRSFLEGGDEYHLGEYEEF
jgi:hypothetical protein